MTNMAQFPRTLFGHVRFQILKNITKDLLAMTSSFLKKLNVLGISRVTRYLREVLFLC